ncbi:MAG: T9SS type A sorting domain-containing protein, partial [Chitinophagales bacterium]
TFRIQDTMCQGQRYFFNNTFITKPGIYQDTITNPFGCDSIVRLYLLLKNGPSDTTQVRVCPGDVYTFGAKTFSGRGIYYDTLKTAGGCDSLRVLFLEYGLNDTVELKNGVNYISAAEGVSYQWYSCNPWKKIANENKKSFTTNTKGSYCVVINNGRCSDTSLCQSLYSSGLMIANQNKQGAAIFPNPVGDRLFISIQKAYRNAQVLVFDALGRSIISQNGLKNSEIEVNTEALTRGIYFIKIELDDMIFYHKIEKE